MEEGLVDSQGYPIGPLYYLVEALAIGRDIRDIHDLTFRNNRQIFLDAGVPECRIMTVSTRIITTQRTHRRIGINSDFDLGIDLPDELMA